MHRLLLWFALLALPWTLSSLEYGLYAKRESSLPIKRFAIFSERCSGSNYLEHLLVFNCRGIASVPFGHKHFSPWYNLPREYYLADYRHYDFQDTDGYLFLVIFRNPYDWAKSLRETPWHAAWSMYNKTFSNFIRMPWVLQPDDPWVVKWKKLHPLLERNPLDGSSFKNIFKLRTAKIQNLLLIKERAKNVYYVNYETLRDHPKEVLKELETIYSLSLHPNYRPIIYYKGLSKAGTYKKKEYTSIDKTDLAYINSQLDEELEREIGYTLTPVR